MEAGEHKPDGDAVGPAAPQTGRGPATGVHDGSSGTSSPLDGAAVVGARRANPCVRLIALFGALVIAAAFAAFAIVANSDAQHSDDTSRAISAAANRLLIDLLNAETGQRGYTITLQERFLQPYNAGVRAVPSDMQALASATAPHPAFDAHISALGSLSAAKLSELAQTVALDSSGHHAAAVALVNNGQGKHIMDLARAQINRVLAQASALPHASRRKAATATVVAVVVDGMLFVLVVALGLWWWTRGRRYERELRRLADAAEHSSDAVISYDLDGCIRRWGAGAERVFGFTAPEVVGLSLAEFNALSGEPENSYSRSFQLVTQALAGKTVRYEAQRRRKDGAVLDLQVTLLPWRRVDGRIAGFTSTAVDITERKTAERELERLAQAAEHSADAVITLDLDGRIRHWSAGAEALLGFSAQEVVGLSASEWNALSGEGEDANRRAAEYPARVLAGEPLRREVKRRHKDGRQLDLQVTLVPWREDGEIVGWTTTTIDVTERKRSEREREQALAGLEEAQRLARLGSWTWDAQAGTATWSAQTYELFGRDPSSGPALGEELARCVHPDDRERITQFAANPPPGGFEFDFRILVGDEGSERTLHAFGHPDPARPGCFMGTFQDVSAARRGEVAQAANRAKSEFLSRMSHELRTPLNAISGFGQLLAMDDLEPRQAEHIDYVLKGADHMLALVNDVLDFSRVEAGQLKVSPEAVALLDTVQGAVALMEPLADAGEVALSVDAGGLTDDGHVHADAQRLKQVLLNVLSNAIKYNHPGGRVDVSFETLDGPPSGVRTLVTDTGIGIAAHDLEKLFEPFERLGAEQRAIEGTGLGLALSKGLIEAMGGNITVSSTPGVGSTFMIELAGVPTPHIEHAHEAPEPQEQRSGAGDAQPRLKVLYIEDNVSNVRLVERVLERHATVEMLPAMQGSLGLGLAREHHPDMIILDLHLPDIDGEVVLTRLKADPSTRDIPVVVLTADASKGLAERLVRIGSCEFLSKPLDVPRLLKVIQTYIDNAARGDASQDD